MRELYGQRLIDEGVITAEELDGFIAEFDAFLDKEFDAGKTYHADKADWLDGKWSRMARPSTRSGAATPPCRRRSCATSA